MDKKTIKTIDKTIEHLKEEYIIDPTGHSWSSKDCALCQTFASIGLFGIDSCGNCPLDIVGTKVFPGCIILAKEICGIWGDGTIRDDIPLYIGALESLKRCDI